MYAQEAASSLTDPTPFAQPPFPSDERQRQSDAAFAQAIPDCTPLFNAASNRNYVPFQNAVLTLIDIVKHQCS